ncbi:MAG: biotin transporter BioY [Candidatus Hydrogenedentes bacterium]|nr:biotin transporter BioY [Candidatus Hydrogenedentota bacterium]
MTGSAALPQAGWGAIPREAPAWRDILGVAGMLLLGAWIRLPLPFTPVPVTLQTFAVLLAPFMVGPGRAMAGTGLYLSAGLAGLFSGVPVFAAASGATAGYLAGFMAVPLVVAWSRSRSWRPEAGMFLSLLLIYFLGGGWLALFLGLSPATAFLQGVAPFLPGDAVKLAATAALARRLSG